LSEIIDIPPSRRLICADLFGDLFLILDEPPTHSRSCDLMLRKRRRTIDVQV
jgi:hypothetical protein